MKGGRKRGAVQEKKGQEEDEDCPRAVENNRESQNLRNGKAPETIKSNGLLFRGC